jgi:hypothetical protein
MVDSKDAVRPGMIAKVAGLRMKPHKLPLIAAFDRLCTAQVDSTQSFLNIVSL